MKTAFLLFLILFGLLPYAQQQKPGGISKMSPAAGKDRFFWYIGKKINDSTLIAATGAAVTLKKAGNQLEVKTAKDPFTKMILELRQTEQRKKELVTNATTHQQAAVIYSYVRNIVEEYAQIANTYAGLADNRIDLPSLPYPSSWQQQEMSSISLKGPCAPEAFSEDIPGWIKTDHNSVMAWVKAHEKEINFQTPAPPVLDVSCYGCDEEKTRDYEYADSAYRSDLFQEETENIHKAVRIMRFATEYPSKELAGILNDLDGSLKYLLGRILLKTQAVEKQWRHDFWRLQTVVKVLLEVERQLQLFYGAGDYGLMQTAVSLLHRDSIQKHFDLAVKDRNYPVVLNAAFWIGMERQRQLLGGPDNFSAEQFEAIMRFNRFKLTHEFDIKWRGDTDGNDQLQVKLRAEDVYYFAIPDSNCRLLFVAHQGTRTHMSADRLVKYSVSEAKRPDALYSSPQRFATTFPIIMMDGCNETASFAFNTDVNGENYAQEKWNEYSNYDGPTGMTIRTALERSFPTQFVEKDKAAELTPVILQPGTDQPVKDLETMKISANMAVATVKHFYRHVEGFRVEAGLTNKNKVLVQEQFDGREENSWNEENEIDYAWIKVRLEHAPVED